MTISICITVYNEETNILALLESLLDQTKFPSEVVIVDAGSKDNTVDLIKQYKHKFKEKKIPLSLVVSKGVSIARGRNISIDNSKGEVIAITDAGCIVRRDWLKKITDPFKDINTDFVAGNYTMTGDSYFQQALKPFLGVPIQRYNPNSFLPSARSIAFRKSIWKEINGFNEKLSRAGEDTFFVYQVIMRGFELVRVKNAIVFWEVPAKLSAAIAKFYYYAKGDSQSRIWWHPVQKLATHNIKVMLIFVRFVAAIVLLALSFQNKKILAYLGFLIILYFVWSIFKMRKFVKTKARFYLPILQVISDLSAMTGFLSGLVRL